MPPKNPKVDLKLKYQRVYEVSLILSILLLISAFRYFPRLENSMSLVIENQPLIKAIDVPLTGAPEIPPPPPKPPIPVEAPDDALLEDIPIEDTEIDFNKKLAKPTPMIVEDEYEYDGIFEAVEEMPKIIGGLSAL
jgi:periplasmic protein TonB